MAPRRSLSVSLLLLIGCQDGGLTKHNAPPTANIVSPTDGETVTEGHPVTLLGTVGDPNGLDGVTARWRAGGDVLCDAAPPDADGGTTCVAALAPGQEEVSLEVVDADEASADDTVVLVVVADDAPTVTIGAPQDGTDARADDVLAFEGSVSDDVDAAADLVVWWESSLDGVLDVDATPDTEGRVAGAGSLSVGQHELTLYATDAAGHTGADLVLVTVTPPNAPPSCTITSPPDSSTGEQGAAVAFTGRVADADEPAAGLDVTWSSDRDGPLSASSPDSDGAVTFTTTTLSQGTHVVTLAVTDAEGATCADDVLYSVGAAPSLALTAPVDGQVVNEGEPLAFTGTVADADHAPGELTIAWSSDVDGAFSAEGPASTGEVSFAISDLSRATHVVTATITDPDGLYGRAVVTVRVNGVPDAPAVSLSPDPATTTDDLVVHVDTAAVDPDGDALTYTYAWTRDGAPQRAYTADTVPASATTKGEVWAVAVTADDGWGESTAGRASVTIANTPPTAPTVTITPGEPTEGDDDLVCAVDTDSVDADGDRVTYTFAWDVDGAAFSGAATTDEADDTVPGDETSGEEVWTCTVTPDDGEDEGTAGRASVSVRGRPVDYAHVQYPCSATIARTTGTLDVYGWVFQPGVTDATGAGAGITAEVGVGDDGTDPSTDASWTWVSASWNEDKPAYGDASADPPPYNNDEYVGTIAAPSSAGAFDYAYRFSTDAGLSWTYVDLGGTTCGGDGTIDGYDAVDAGQLTVVP